jgi:hypothetical protein
MILAYFKVCDLHGDSGNRFNEAAASHAVLLCELECLIRNVA